MIAVVLVEGEDRGVWYRVIGFDVEKSMHKLKLGKGESPNGETEKSLGGHAFTFTLTPRIAPGSFYGGRETNRL